MTGAPRSRRGPLLRAGMEAVLASGVRVPVSGGCMAPTVPKGATVRLAPCSPAGLLPGDVVLLERDGVFVLHRYLRTIHVGAQRRLLVMADRGGRPDAPWEPRAVVGRLCEVDDGTAARPYGPRRGERVLAWARGIFWANVFPFLKQARDSVRPRRRGR